MMFALDLHPYSMSRLGSADLVPLQNLYERCSDFHEIEEGVPTQPGAAEHLLAALPPGKTSDDKHVLGIYHPNGDLIGALDLIRDCPGRNEWWLGLLLLDPQVRGAGLGTRLYHAVAEAISRLGGRAIFLGVLEHNAAAERFWRRQGFVELRRQPYTSGSGQQSRVIVMHHLLAQHGAAGA